MNAPHKKSLAVALHYEQPGTPRVVAKGTGEIDGAAAGWALVGAPR